MSRQMSTRPSTLLGIEGDPLAAFCFDRAVFNFGSSLKGELDGVSGKNHKEIEGKQTKILRKWLPEAVGSTKFADPAARKKKG